MCKRPTNCSATNLLASRLKASPPPSERKEKSSSSRLLNDEIEISRFTTGFNADDVGTALSTRRGINGIYHNAENKVAAFSGMAELRLENCSCYLVVKWSGII